MKTLKYAIRFIIRMKVYSIICILGLVISMAGTLTLIRYIHQELTVDHYLEDLDKLHLLGSYIPSENFTRLDNNRNWNRETEFVDPLDHPTVESYTMITILPKGEIVKDKHHFPVRAIAADTAFFQFLPRETSAGSTDRLPPTGVILTEEFAKLIFGKENPIGQPMTYSGKEVTVYGIVKAPSTKTSINYDIVLSHKLQREWMGMGNADQFCLVRLHQAEDLDKLNAYQPILRLKSYGGRETRFQLSPFKEFYMNPSLMPYQAEEMCTKGDRNGIRILILVAGLLFFIGTLNYLNLYTVIMQKRGLEFGVKKVFGAGHWAFLKQLYIENFLLSAITLLFVGMIIEITDKILVNTLEIPLQSNTSFDLTLGVIMLLGFPLLTMIYPYFRYVYSKPVASLKRINQGGGSPIVRNLFLCIQFVISFCLIVVSVYFAKQLNEMLNADLGFRTKDIMRCILIPAENHDNIIRDRKAWEEEVEKDKRKAAYIAHTLNACPFIQTWSIGDDVWEDDGTLCSFMKKDAEEEFIHGSLSGFSIADIQLYDLQIIEGRGWDDNIDKFTNYNLIINESAKKALGITDINTDQIQTKERIWWSTDTDCSGNPPFNIVGVIKDYHNNHLSRRISPTIYTYNPSFGEYIHPGSPFIIRYQPGKQQELLQVLSNLRNEISGEGELEHSYLEDEIAKRYENEKRIVYIYMTFAALAIAVSCLGLFGLSLFEIRLRYREIALRKVHGAKVSDIVRLLLKRYLKLLAISALIAFPLSVFFIHKYMEDYAFRTPLSGWIFLLALLVISAISAGVLLWQIHKASNIDPAKIMKTE